MSDGRMKLVGPDGEEKILMCELAIENVLQPATAMVWRDDGGRVVSLTVALESDKRIGFAVAFPAGVIEVLCQVLKKAKA